MNKKFCVYTVLLGDYELLNEQPVAKDSEIDFICFTDNKNLVSQTWKLKHIQPVFPFDLARSSRVPKICPHRFLPEYDTSLYIDNSVVLKKPAKMIFNEILKDREPDIVFLKHSFRETVLDEFIQVARSQFDDLNIIVEQLNAYYLTAPDILKQKPLKGNFLLRKHNKKEVIETMEEWLAHVLRYSRRDQLSVNYILHEKKLKIHKLDVNVLDSEYFFWPVTQGRDRERYKNHGMLLKQLIDEVGEKEQKNKLSANLIVEKDQIIQSLEQKLREEKDRTIQILGQKEAVIQMLEAELKEIKQTISWRMLQPFRKIWSRVRSKIYFKQ